MEHSSRWNWMFTSKRRVLLLCFVLCAAVTSALALAPFPASQLMEGLDLKQNYPNPFSSSTEIRYTIPLNGHVLLRVFNMLGQEVQVLANESKPAGDYFVRFDGTGYPSGQYTYSLVFTSDDNSETAKLTKKMYLVR
jgi:hypothetical protein